MLGEEEIQNTTQRFARTDWETLLKYRRRQRV